MNQDRRQFLLASVAAGAAAAVPFSWPVKKTRPSVVVMVFGQLNGNGHHYVKESFVPPPEVPLYDLEMSKLLPDDFDKTKMLPVGVGRNPRIEGDNLLFDLTWHGQHAIPEHAVRTRGYGVLSPTGVVSDYVMDGLMLTETPA